MLQKINLINVYSSNEDNPSFFEKLFLTVPALEGLYILGGDFNCALDPLINNVEDLRLVEIWRSQNLNKGEYSCYSSSYKTHSHVDYYKYK